MSRTIPFPVHQIALASVFLALAAMLGGCNTVEGMGQDVQSGGRAIERTAQ
ncbi:entericidin A/B family lipoprotein [Azospirillum thermophilum]|uniref:Entericidin EcnAB n=1 Tax=Azospirillum thermophilum TaxID=2202148 RepID=A0A2S2CKW2_9PROT|nr:entericidin A/B family lipoprotein [Azospirillum thermophilum]AWK85155.1 entericidin EcnAB [Azospirillum thermophilum]